MKRFIPVLIVFISVCFANKISAGTLEDTPEAPIYTMEELQSIADSVLIEGTLLALYERAAWVAGDNFGSQPDEIRRRYGGYLAYHDENQDVRVIFADSSADELKCIYEMVFYDDPENPSAESSVERSFTEWEETLWTDRGSIIEEITNKGIEVTYYDDFPLNHILFPTYWGYRLYLISGTTLNGIIPFGNDYFFDVDPEGNIVNWRKMHSRLIAEPMEFEGYTVLETTQSHLRSEPFITPTDVCTFQLYAPYSEMKKLKIYSTALKLYFVYDWQENVITIEESPVRIEPDFDDTKKGRKRSSR